MSKLTDYQEKNGRFPRVSLLIKPLGAGKLPLRIVDRFISYNFKSSILTPVDTFTFTFVNPYAEDSFLDFAVEGDVAILQVNDVTVATGIIDTIVIDTTSNGEFVEVSGRDLMGQLVDNNAVTIQDDMMHANRTNIQTAVAQLIQSTRIKGIAIQDTPSGTDYLFATEPGESKMDALQRFVEPLNCIAWMTAEGRIKVGRPNMAQAPKGVLIMDREKRISNVTGMKAVRSSTQIPNIILPIFSSQEQVEKRLPKTQALHNAASGPNRLRKLGHIVQRTVVVSDPGAEGAQGLADVNDYKVSNVGGSLNLQAYAKKVAARSNISELIVMANVPGHTNDDLVPFMIDQIHTVRYPKAKVDEKMYLYEVEYSLTADQGPKTSFSLTKLGTIVSDVRAR